MHYDDLCEVFFSSSLEVYPGYFCILHIDHDKKLIVYAISFNKKRAGNVILAFFFSCMQIHTESVHALCEI